MPVTIVIGGQFGSEGKGKVAQRLAAERAAAVAVRVGGPNSGHTGVGTSGEQVILRQLPTAALNPGTICVVGLGSYIDVPLLLAEVERTELAADRLVVDPQATLVTDADRERERELGLSHRLGGTGSGTTGAVLTRIERETSDCLAGSAPELKPFLRDSVELLRSVLSAGGRVVVEGTQGFGLSLLHSPWYPKATGRDTTAAAAVAEAGLSPLDVDEVVLVTRAFPIRVAGDSGPFGSKELTWEDVARRAGLESLAEHTSVTGRVRRVAEFDPELVRRAIAVNRPSVVVMNHLDYFGAADAAEEFLADAEASLGRSIAWVGYGPADLRRRCGGA